LQGTAQRFALLAGGRAWTMLIIVGNAEARKMLENGAESHQSSARFVGQLCACQGDGRKKPVQTTLISFTHNFFFSNYQQIYHANMLINRNCIDYY
jgi:hypothetical protein